MSTVSDERRVVGEEYRVAGFARLDEVRVAVGLCGLQPPAQAPPWPAGT